MNTLHRTMVYHTLNSWWKSIIFKIGNRNNRQHFSDKGVKIWNKILTNKKESRSRTKYSQANILCRNRISYCSRKWNCKKKKKCHNVSSLINYTAKKIFVTLISTINLLLRNENKSTKCISSSDINDSRVKGHFQNIKK